MADTFKTYNTLKFVATFSDGDTRTLSIENPDETNLGQKLKALQTLAANVLIGDKYGAPFVRFADARIVQGTRVELDIEAKQ